MKSITKDKEGHYIMIKECFHKAIILNLYVCNNMASKYRKQKLKKIKDRQMNHTS